MFCPTLAAASSMFEIALTLLREAASATSAKNINENSNDRANTHWGCILKTKSYHFFLGSADVSNLTSQGQLTWTPSSVVLGTYELRFAGDLDGSTDDEILQVAIRHDRALSEAEIDELEAYLIQNYTLPY
jgi:hypothetical protein